LVCENAAMIAVEVQHYLGRARDFLKGMALLRDDLGTYKASSALLGIHSAISYSDALRTGMGCDDVSLDNHLGAANDLKARLASRKFENFQATRRLGRLLSSKNRVSYAAMAPRESEIEDILKQAERFAFWAEETGKQLQIEGWSNGSD
jgi:hypothetical protein